MNHLESLVIVVVLSFSTYSLVAQSLITQSISCGTDQAEPVSSSGPLENCLEGYDFEEDGPINIAICVHYFTTDDCSGGVGTQNPPEQFDQSETFGISERLVDVMNTEFLENNAIQKGDPNAADPAPSIPFRFVLKRVEIHCDDEIRDVSISTTSKIGKIKNKPQYLHEDCYNVFVTHCQGGNKPGRTGHASSTQGGFSLIQPYYISEDPTEFNFWKVSAGNLWHEIGHNFGLQHAHEGVNTEGGDWGLDKCDDTPATETFEWTWDANCDGIIMDYEVSGKNVKERDPAGCWQKNSDPNNPWGQTSDWNHNSVVDCEENGDPGEACNAHPCCDAENINNNFMAYSIEQNAATNCQIEKMLNNVDDYYCDAIISIGDCSPASAFISLIKEEEHYDQICSRCIYLSASHNEDTYRLTIREASTDIVIYDLGWISGEAQGTWCYSSPPVIVTQNPGVSNYLEPNTDYVARMEVSNTCNSDLYDMPFNTGVTLCDPISPYDEWFGFTGDPNPVSQFLNINYHVDVAGDVAFYRQGMQSSDFQTLQSSSPINIGVYTVQFNSSTWSQGLHTIIMQYQGQLKSIAVIKS